MMKWILSLTGLTISLCSQAGPIPFTYEVISVNETSTHPSTLELIHPFGSVQTAEHPRSGYLSSHLEYTMLPIVTFSHPLARPEHGLSFVSYYLDVEVKITDTESGESGNVHYRIGYWSLFEQKGEDYGWDWVADYMDDYCGSHQLLSLGRHQYWFFSAGGLSASESQKTGYIALSDVQSDPIVTTPEPTTLGIALVGLISAVSTSFIRRRRRKRDHRNCSDEAESQFQAV